MRGVESPFICLEVIFHVHFQAANCIPPQMLLIYDENDAIDE